MNIRTSPLVEMATEAKRPTRWWLGWIVAVLIIAVGGADGQAIGAFGVVIGAFMMGVGVLALTVMGQYESGESQHTNLGAGALALLLPLAVVFLLQASTEEAITRGYMLQIGGLQLPGWVAVIATSVIFSVLHVGASPLALVNIALYAVFASFVALGQGSLWLICGIHAGWNYFQGNIFGVPVSGNPEANSLLAFGPGEGSSDVLSGGAFGIEASLAGTVVLVMAMVIAFVTYRRAEQARGASASATPTVPSSA